jgi:branched-chain amino acid transport system substrate-binding protein
MARFAWPFMLIRSLRRIGLLALLLLMTPIVAGCGGSDDDSGADGGFDGTIKIGLNVELSGPGSFFGASRRIGADVAVKDINAGGGVKVGDQSYRLELVVNDNRTDPTYGVQAAEEQVSEGVLWAVPPDLGFEAAYEIYRENDVVMVANGGTASDLLLEDADAHPLLFFEFGTYDRLVETWIISVKAAYPDVQTVGVLLPDDSNGRAEAAGFEHYASKHGLEVADVQFHPPDATGDFSTFLTSLKAENPDAVFIGYFPQVVIPAAKQGAQLDVADVFFTDYVPTAFDEIGDLGGHPFVAASIAWSFTPEIVPPNPDEQALAKKLDAEAGGETYCTACAVAAYVSDITLVKEAVERAGTIDDSEAIASELLSGTYDGPFGPAKVQPNHSVDIARNSVVIDEKGDITGYVFDSGFDTEPSSSFPINRK